MMGQNLFKIVNNEWWIDSLLHIHTGGIYMYNYVYVIRTNDDDDDLIFFSSSVNLEISSGGTRENWNIMTKFLHATESEPHHPLKGQGAIRNHQRVI